MLRRRFIQGLLIATAGYALPVKLVHSKTYLTVEQAMKILWPGELLTSNKVELSDEQVELIEDKSDVNVRNSSLNAWKSENGGWFIVDQVIGKHENIDLAVALDNQGRVMGIEILTYRETYGDQIMHPKWRAQFHGKDNSEHLKLDHQIKNISGATLSCRHVIDGINRLTQTWSLVLKYL